MLPKVAPTDAVFVVIIVSSIVGVIDASGRLTSEMVVSRYALTPCSVMVTLPVPALMPAYLVLTFCCISIFVSPIVTSPWLKLTLPVCGFEM